MTEKRSLYTQTGKARWTRLAVFGLTLAATGPLLMLVAGAAFGLDVAEAAPFLGPPIVVGFLAAFLVSRFGTWAKIVGIFAALAVLFFVWWTVFSLSAPASFFDFVPGLLVVPGGIMALVGCIRGIRAAKRGNFTHKAEGGERTTIRVALAIIGVLAVVSAVLTVVSRTTVDPGTQTALTVETDGFEWDKDSYNVVGGSKILVSNQQPFLHTFTIDSLRIDEKLGPGSEVAVTIPAEPGTYTFYCKPHTREPENPTEEDMTATLVVS